MIFLKKIQDGLFVDSNGNKYCLLRDSLNPCLAISIDGDLYSCSKIETEDASISPGVHADKERTSKHVEASANSALVRAKQDKTFRSSIRKKMACICRKLVQGVQRQKYTKILSASISSRRVRFVAKTRAKIARHCLRCKVF